MTTGVLPLPPAFDAEAMRRFFAFRAIPGVESVSGNAYRRTIRTESGGGMLRWRFTADRLEFEASGDVGDVEPRLRRMFDLDADLPRIEAHLSEDPFMASLVAARPGLSVPGGWDPFEVAIRAVLGQQVSVVAARGLAARLVERCGEAFGDDRLFPTPLAVVEADLSAMGMPGARVAALRAVAAAALEDPRLFERGPSVEATVARLRGIKGVGEWTAQYVAMRACHEPDAFPAGDVGLRRAMADASGVRPSSSELLARAEAWRPYRAYAAAHLWAVLG